MQCTISPKLYRSERQFKYLVLLLMPLNFDPRCSNNNQFAVSTGPCYLEEILTLPISRCYLMRLIRREREGGKITHTGGKTDCLVNPITGDRCVPTRRDSMSLVYSPGASPGLPVCYSVQLHFLTLASVIKLRVCTHARLRGPRRRKGMYVCWSLGR